MESTIKRQHARNFKANVQQDIVNSEKCNCRDKSNYLLDGVCKTEGVIYKAEIKDVNSQSNVHAGCTEGNFRKRWDNHKSSFKIESHRNCTRLASHVWELTEKNNKSLNISWGILRKARPYSDVCRLCQEEKLAIITYPDQRNLLNERSEVMPGCKHTKRYTLGLY